MPLTVVKPGTQKRDFTHIDDIIKGTILATKKTINSEYHIGSGKNYTILEVAKLFKTKIKFLLNDLEKDFIHYLIAKQLLKN